MSEKKSGRLKAWEKFYGYFPEIELPVTLSGAYTSAFTKDNKPLPTDLIDQFILGQTLFFADAPETEPDSELVEFVPCFRLPENKAFFALVYWKASLLKYEFILHTFDPQANSLATQVIASTSSDGRNIREIVATIDMDLEIYIIGGDTDDPDNYDPEKSKAFSLEITPQGQIIHHFED